MSISGRASRPLHSPLTEGVEIGRRLVAAEPDVVVWKQELAESLLHKADVKAGMGDAAEALSITKRRCLTGDR